MPKGRKPGRESSRKELHMHKLLSLNSVKVWPPSNACMQGARAHCNSLSKGEED